MTSPEMIAALMWYNDRWEHTDGPRSTVGIVGPPDKYSDVELAAFVDFATRKDAWYDSRWNTKQGCNVLFFDRPEHTDQWKIDKITWQHPSWADTQTEALERMTDWKRN